MSTQILVGDVRETLAQVPDATVQCCVTSPPYFGLRDYGHEGQIGLESTPDEYVAQMVAVFREVRRVLRNDGTLWLNIGDSYSDGGTGVNRRQRNATNANTNGGVDRKKDALRSAASCPSGCRYSRSIDQPYPRLCIVCGRREPGPDQSKAKDLLGIPWRVAFALQVDGWYLRSDIIWHKPNPMPESVRDRPTKAHEYVFLLTKSERYYYDARAIAEEATGRAPGNVNPNKHAGEPFSDTKRNPSLIGPSTTRNARTVWTITTRPFRGAHFATMPPALAERCVKAGSKAGDTVLDPFGGAGTTGLVAQQLGRNSVLCEINPVYAQMALDRIQKDAPLLYEGRA